MTVESKLGDDRKRAQSFGAVEREVGSVLTELAHMAKQISAQLDARAARLETLIRAADERIERLRSMDALSATATPSAPQSPAANVEQQRYVRIYALADDGLSADRIAQKLEMPKGEVELILALRARG